MIARHYTILCLITAILAGCESQSSIYEEKLKRDKFIEREYSVTDKSKKERPALETSYYNEITSGRVVVGMNLLETKLATKTHPYGQNRNNLVYWCNETPVPECENGCDVCAAILFGENQTHFLQGKGLNLVVVNSIDKQNEDTVFNFRNKEYKVVSALFRNQIVEGMDMRDFQRIKLPSATKQQYFCKNHRVFNNCLNDCTDCTINLITPRENQFHVQSVRFRGKYDYKTIVDVKESIQPTVQ